MSTSVVVTNYHSAVGVASGISTSNGNSAAAVNYDEDISENPFFRFLCEEHRQFYEVASESRWIVCVPRKASLPLEALHIFDDQDVAAYILVPQDDEGRRYKTLNGRRVELSEGQLKTVSGFEENDDVISILFEETFFNVNDESYKVLCLEKPFDLGVILNATFDGDGASGVIDGDNEETDDDHGRWRSSSGPDADSYSLEDCARILWGHAVVSATRSHAGNRGGFVKRRSVAAATRLRNSLEALVLKFNKIDEASNENLTLDQLVDRVHTVYKDALSLILYAKRKSGAPLASGVNAAVDSIKIALETYILHNVHVNLWTNLTRHFCEEDAEFNKITRNLAPWVSLADLGFDCVRSEFQVNLPRARQILAKLNQVVTPRGKARILRRTVEVLSQVGSGGGGRGSGAESRRQSYDVGCRQSTNVVAEKATSKFYVAASSRLEQELKEDEEVEEEGKIGQNSSPSCNSPPTSTSPSLDLPSPPTLTPPPEPPPPPPLSALTSDDLLPLLCFLIIRSDCIANWKANLFYLRQLQFASSKIDKDAFLLTSFEAALLHVESFFDKDKPTVFTIPVCKSSLDFNLSGRSNDVRDGIFRLFDSVAKGDVEKVTKTLMPAGGDVLSSSGHSTDEASEHDSARHPPTCHPLCRCAKCRPSLFSSSNADFNSDILVQNSDDNADIDAEVADGVTLLAKDDRGFSALHVAALFDQTAMVELLVDLGALVNAADHYGRTPLHLAGIRGAQKAVLLLLHSKADPNLRDCDGMTALHSTVLGGHLICAKALLYYDQGYLLNVNATSNSGDTALHIASRLGFVDLVDTLLENGASVVIKNGKNETPLHCAHSVVVGRRLAVAYQRVLEERKYESAAASELERKPSSSSKALKSNKQLSKSKSMPEKLVNPTLPINHPSSTDNTSPSFAKRPSLSPAKSQHAPSQPFLTPHSSPPSSFANNNTVSALASSDVTDDAYFRKVERLFRAIGDGDEQLVRHFMGWDWDESVPSDSTSLQQEQRELCHPLCDCADCRPLQRQISATQKSGLTVNCSNREGITPLHIAALYDSLTLAKLFLSKGAVINAKTKTQQWTPLHLAAQRNSVHVGDVLVVNGADLNAADIRGNAALHYAALNGFLAITEVLLSGDVGCGETVDGGGRNTRRNSKSEIDSDDQKRNLTNFQVNAVNVKGNTPLHVLAGRATGSQDGGAAKSDTSDDGNANNTEEDAVKIAKLLIEKGADLRILNRQNRTAYDLAIRDNVKAVLKTVDVETREDYGKGNVVGCGEETPSLTTDKNDRNNKGDELQTPSVESATLVAEEDRANVGRRDSSGTDFCRQEIDPNSVFNLPEADEQNRIAKEIASAIETVVV